MDWYSGISSAHQGSRIIVGAGDESDPSKVAGLFHELLHEQLNFSKGDKALLEEWNKFQSDVRANMPSLRSEAAKLAGSFEKQLATYGGKPRDDLQKAAFVERIERLLLEETFVYQKEERVRYTKGLTLLKAHGKKDVASAATSTIQGLLRLEGRHLSGDKEFSVPTDTY